MAWRVIQPISNGNKGKGDFIPRPVEKKCCGNNETEGEEQGERGGGSSGKEISQTRRVCFEEEPMQALSREHPPNATKTHLAYWPGVPVT